MTVRKRLHAVQTALLLWTLLPATAAAQFSASPAVVRLSTDDAAEVALVRVRNESAAVMQFRIYLGDYDQNEAGDFHFTEYGAGRGSCAGRLAVYPDAMLLEPGAAQDVRLRLDTGTLACWALLFVESSATAAGQVRVAHRIGVRVVHAPRALEPDGEVTAVDIAFAADSLDVNVGFANVGPVPVEVKGVLEVRSLQDGRVVRSVAVGPLGVLPDSRRRIPVRLANDLAAGRYLVVPILDLGAAFLAGGQAELTVR
jgi:hypothetical protein